MSKNQKSIRTIGVYLYTGRFHARLNLVTVAGRDSLLFHSVHTGRFRKNIGTGIAASLELNTKYILFITIAIIIIVVIFTMLYIRRSNA